LDDECQAARCHALLPHHRGFRGLEQHMSVYCGRYFSPEEIQTICDLMRAKLKLKRSPLTRKLCEPWH